MARLLAGALIAALLASCASGLRERASGAPPTVDTAKAAPAGRESDDGPHIKDIPGGSDREAIWVCGNALQRARLAAGRHEVDARCGFPKSITLRDETHEFPLPTRFSARRLAALSDVHGQFDLMVRLLVAHRIIDANLNWSFGDGHLVIIGDHFDRGPRVTEVLWLLHQLEPQAERAGGRVHTLLGNHETMVLYDDLRYVHPKYATIAREHGIAQPSLFGTDSVLGRWLRAKPVVIQINDMLFVHGGLSLEFLDLNLTLPETNERFRASIGMPRPAVRTDPQLAILYGASGPLWHRGYFVEPAMTAESIDRVLKRFTARRIVVGHTSFKGVFSHHDGRVLSVDSDLKGGKSGELLFWDEGVLSRGTLQGARLPLPAYSAVAPSAKQGSSR